jgi:integrase
MSIFRRGKHWSYEFVFRGQRIRNSTGSNSKTLAARAERQRRRELEESANGITPVRQPKLFCFASREWIDLNKARWSKSNLAIQEFNLKHLLKFLKSTLVGDITAAHVGQYQLQRKGEKASNRTVNMEIAKLRQILKAERLWGTVARDVKRLRESVQIGKALTPDEEARLLTACRNSSSPSLFPAVVIFCYTGLRNGELRCARWSQVDFFRAEFHVGKSKTDGGSGRVIPLNHSALSAFREWRTRFSDAQPEDFIFPSEKLVFRGVGSADRGRMTSYGLDRNKPLGSWKTAWSTAKREANVQCRIHDLRHHFISALAQTQTPDATIQAISGHLSSRMLDHYSHVRLEAKRRAVESIGLPVRLSRKAASDPAESQDTEPRVPTAEDVN